MAEKSAENGNGTVLFVDDESNILSSLRRLFRPEGYKILTANSAAEGLDILEAEPVDLVVSDMRMPEMDGARLLEIIAQKWPATMRILLTGYADIGSAIHAINRGNIYKYISKPWEDNDIKTAVSNAIAYKRLIEDRDRLQRLTNQQNKALKGLNESLEDKVKERTEALRATHRELEDAYGNLKHSYGATVKMFASLMEFRGGMMSGHSRKVADYAYRLAQRMKVDKGILQDILFAGMLHDLGYLALPDRLANAPYYSLNTEDRAEVAKHPVIAEAAIMAIEPMKGAAQIIRHHHELFDGRGYPDGLVGKKIPLGARIFTVVDEYDGLIRGILRTNKMSAPEAREYIRKHSHVRYDPVVVNAFIEEFSECADTSSHAPPEKDISMRSGQLTSGMIIAQDLIVRNGLLLLSKGHVLDMELIENIRRFETSLDERFKIYVEEFDPEEALME